MKRAVLEAVATGAVRSKEDLQRFVHCTLLAAQHGTAPVAAATVAALGWLQQREARMLAWGPSKDPGAGADPVWSATKLGAAVVASGLDLEEVEGVRGDLETSSTCLNLKSVLQSMYLIVPPALVNTSLRALLQRADVWQAFHRVLEALPVGEGGAPAALRLGAIPTAAAACRMAWKRDFR